MRVRSRVLTTGAQFLFCLALAGCAQRGAPTLSLFGAYFPVWILCGIVGVATAAVTRGVLVATGLSSAIPAQLLVCTAMGVIVASLVWLWLGQ